MTAKELRKKYLEFFEKKGHAIIPSASLIPEHDPTVLFTTAGMHPLVPHLLGEPHPAGRRLANVQKSMRTDDIDDVGDPWHNTFFEMLGNWSLGDYWKKEAIEWSFEFLTQELKLDPKRIYVTVFGSDPEIPGVGEDEETIQIWKDLGIAENRIFRLGKKDNWWGPVGQAGPCGPDTEMFYDTGRVEHGEKCHPGETCGKYAEIWNDVFMEFNKTADGTYVPLKQKNVDTGMGIERTTAVLQGKDNVYDTELFQEAMKRIKNKATEEFNLKDARIIADHLRAATFLIADGVEPISANDRGSVLVRLITRSITSARKIGIEGSFASWITDSYINFYKDEYPELLKKKDLINNKISQEEKKYLSRVHSPVTKKLEQEEISKAQADPRGTIESKASNVSGSPVRWEDLKQQHEITMSSPTPSAAIGTVSADLKFTRGIPQEETFGTADAILKGDFNKEEAEATFNAMTALHRQASKQKEEKRFAGGLADHTEVTIRGHTATHLLHQALRDELGNQVYQTGSNITPERIRFDFSYGEKLTKEQIKRVEEVVNQKTKEDLPVKKEIMSVEEGKKAGAIGLFEEKYGERVSVYSIDNYSKEFCGGPHVEHTAQVGKFKIIKEEALGAGQRRIRAILNN
ncbi:MAG TPA: alanine--tRNA ligase-related protein [Candidatus Nanoarchaeia archaeon]